MAKKPDQSKAPPQREVVPVSPTTFGVFLGGQRRPELVFGDLLDADTYAALADFMDIAPNRYRGGASSDEAARVARLGRLVDAYKRLAVEADTRPAAHRLRLRARDMTLKLTEEERRDMEEQANALDAPPRKGANQP